jgi:two-component system response regulator RegA
MPIIDHSEAAASSIGHLLLVDDDALLSSVLARALGARGFAVRTAMGVQSCAAALAHGPRPDFALLDLRLGEDSGLPLIKSILQASPECAIVVMTGFASIATAVDAIKLGARQYLAKPVGVDAIVKALVEDERPELAAVPREALSVARLQWEHIQRVLADHGGNISAAARALKMHRRTLQRRLAKRAPAR